MEHIIDPETYVGLKGLVVPKNDDPFFYEFYGTVIGVRKGFLQVRDMDNDVFAVEVSQFTPETSS